MSDGRLYRLLPAIYRQRDQALGGPLAALLAAMEDELEAAEADTAAMYENAFVETADEAALVRLAALVGVEQLATSVASVTSPRRLVANAIAYHRSKGVPGSLERAVTDVTGWPARVVEGFALLGRTQHLSDVRTDRGAIVDVRRLQGVDPVRDPFPVAATRPDVRPVAADPARRSPSTVTVFVWPVRSLPTGPARVGAVARPRGCFTFHPLGLDQPLFTRPSPAAGRPGPAQIPRRITRRLLEDERDALFGAASGTSIAVSLRGRPLGPADVDVVDLGDWTARPTETNRVALDPERGRLAFAGRVTAPQVEFEACYGAAADLGGGPYDRRATLAPGGAGEVRISRGDGEDAAATVAGAVRATSGSLVVTVVDDLVVDAALDLVLPLGADVVIQAADATRPGLIGGVTVRAPDGPAALTLNGFAIGGGVTAHRPAATAPHALHAARRCAHRRRRRERSSPVRRHRPQLLRADPAGGGGHGGGVQQCDRRWRRPRPRRRRPDRAGECNRAVRDAAAGDRARSRPGR